MAINGWEPIKDLPSGWASLADDQLAALLKTWGERHPETPDQLATFQERLKRTYAIEAGVIERLYTIDTGVTQTLIAHGIDAAYIPHGATDKPAGQVIDLVKDQSEALEGIFKFVNGTRPLSISYIKELHQVMARHQDSIEAVDQFGNTFQVPLLKGEWKQRPNNPTLPNGDVFHYCPPEQVQPQMEQILKWHDEHLKMGVPPEVEAAWLHHRFVLIHPFQDGNGRIARLLASMVFIKSGGFPLLITREGRGEYIDALRAADAANLQPLVALFAARQQQVIVQALDELHEPAIPAHLSDIINYAQERLEQRDNDRSKKIISLAQQLWTHTDTRLKQIVEDIQPQFQNEFEIRVVHGSHDEAEKATWWRGQIVEGARRQGYFANMRPYHAWHTLSIQPKPIPPTSIVPRSGDYQTALGVRVLFSFHFATRSTKDGLMACSGLVFAKGEDIAFHDLQTLSLEPFYFSHADHPEKKKPIFETWLDDAIKVGLVYWARGL